MKSRNALLVRTLFLSTVTCLAAPSRADVAIVAKQGVGQVKLEFAGSIDLTGLGTATPTFVRGIVYPVNSFVEFGPPVGVNNAADMYESVVIAAPNDLGTGQANFAVARTGSYFSIGRNAVEVPLGYVSGSPISGTMTTKGSFASMGLDIASGPYEWTLVNGEKVTLRFIDNSAQIRALQKKIAKLKRQIRVAKKNDATALANRLGKQLRRVNAQLRRLT